MESPSTTPTAKSKQSPAAGADHVSHPHPGVGPEPPLGQQASGADVDSSAAAAALLPQLTQSLVMLADKVETLGATLREVHADMAVLKAQYGALAAAAQGCATYGVQMTVTFTPQPLPQQQPHHPVGAPSPLPHGHHRHHVAPAPATPGHVTPHVMSPSPAPLRKFVDNVATATARAGTPPQPFGAAQTGGSAAAAAPRGLHKAERHHPRKRTSSTGPADHRLPASYDGRPAKKPRRDKNKMFVFLDHINNSRVVDDDEGDAGDVDDDEDNRSGRREGELEIVAGSSDEEGEAVEEAVAETSSEGEEEEEDREENESDEEDGENQAASSSTTAAILADIGEPPHREPITWIGVDVPVEGKPLNHRLMPEKITKSDQLHVFWQRMKQNIVVETSGKGCWLCTCVRPTPNSYVRKSVAGKKFFAHILTYLVWNRTIDVNLPVVQLCGNRVCLNPKHLSQVKNGPLDTDQRADCLERRSLETCPFSPPCIGHHSSSN
ncbi:uncharacterized protein ACA1_065870 [Acanthamoeba castellanii str. Neff]|uniref:Zinc-binding loop region of homing endonuclease domain-containing protein n=1 Tax=Acanthamoeba castellanii (strain ATCC 30010 / Neff) TaxID=1257118 RepID=L8H052_ACACF|nr:uncharacterized protein ACA1_065870 [Acanthamoeba castellanii str. Neff]ELR17766.1 hypothetical protein ACA1_065870 [Acanthamoeba castellanii str. Neff]